MPIRPLRPRSQFGLECHLNLTSDLERVVSAVEVEHRAAVAQLITKLKKPLRRLWYAEQTTANGWSRNMLVHWMESDLYSRQGKAVTSFKNALPQAQSDLANEIIRDPYNFDFLTLRDQAAERELEDGLLASLAARKFGCRHEIRITGNQNELVDLGLVGEGCDVQPDAHIDALLAKVQSKIVIAKARPVAPSVEERLERIWCELPPHLCCGYAAETKSDLPETPQMLMERTPPLSQV